MHSVTNCYSNLVAQLPTIMPYMLALLNLTFFLYKLMTRTILAHDWGPECRFPCLNPRPPSFHYHVAYIDSVEPCQTASYFYRSRCVRYSWEGLK
jgi:hypothetical protein